MEAATIPEMSDHEHDDGQIRLQPDRHDFPLTTAGFLTRRNPVERRAADRYLRRSQVRCAVMRVGTWNLERSVGRRLARQREVLAALNLDVHVLTEVTAEYTPMAGKVVRSPAERIGRSGPESWVAIDGPAGLEPIETPYDRLAAAARLRDPHGDVIVYGAVLPWLSAPVHAPDLRQGSETSAEMFARVLDAQVCDLQDLQLNNPDSMVIWAGDFNQPLEGSNAGFSRRRRQLLDDKLSVLGMTAWNRQGDHARPGMRAIDLICTTTAGILAGETTTIGSHSEGQRLSDHLGYWIEFTRA